MLAHRSRPPTGSHRGARAPHLIRNNDVERIAWLDEQRLLVDDRISKDGAGA